MAKVKVRTFDTAKPAAPDGDVQAGGGVSTLGLFDAADDPIHAHLHHMPAGTSVTWRDSSRGHLAYVWDGAVRVGDVQLDAGGTVVIEHGAGTTIHALQPTTLLVFHASDACADAPVRAGGHVHALAPSDAPSVGRTSDNANVGATLYADSSCATCELWLHGNDFHDGDFLVKPHYHSEDEVIVVTGGEIVLGARRFGRGTAIAVQRDTIYGFRTGEHGLSFINFRPAHPSFGHAGQAEPIDERHFYAVLPAPTFTGINRSGMEAG